MSAKNYQTALVTGASRGLGKSIAIGLAKQGLDIVLVARTLVPLRELAKELQSSYGVRTWVLDCDLSKSSAAQQIYDFTAKNNIAIDVLVNNAGFGVFGNFAQSSPEVTNDILNVNIRSLVTLTRLYLPDMIARNSGKVVNMASLGAYAPGPYMALYFATKAFVLSFSVGINHELRGSQVSVAAICPGPTQSDFGNRPEMSEHGWPAQAKLPSAEGITKLVIASLDSRRATWLRPSDRLKAKAVSLISRERAASLIARNFTKKKL